MQEIWAGNIIALGLCPWFRCSLEFISAEVNKFKLEQYEQASCSKLLDGCAYVFWQQQLVSGCLVPVSARLQPQTYFIHIQHAYMPQKVQASSPSARNLAMHFQLSVDAYNGTCNQRWRRSLIKKVIQQNKHWNDATVSPVIRQSLLHWAYELTEEDFDRTRQEM